MKTLNLGIDIGSVTAKLVIVGPDATIKYSAYRRHHTEVLSSIVDILKDAEKSIGEIQVDLLITGSAGLGLTEKYNLPFIQEVVASAEVVNQLHPEVKTLIDIGGEDAKVIFFDQEGRPDIRMNGSCAGGTGAFIDEMATLMDVPVSQLNHMAASHTMIYPIASRCGVFAKTDLQNLLSRDLPKADIAASVFHAVVLQTLATLARGHDVNPKLLFSGGPLTFLPSLKQAFITGMGFDEGDVIEIENGELLPAYGAALAENADRITISLQELIDRLEAKPQNQHANEGRLPQLFDDDLRFNMWEDDRSVSRIPRVDIKDLNGEALYLGVDSGSTTTKLVLMDEEGRLAYDYYVNNAGNAIRAVRRGLEELNQQAQVLGKPLRISQSVVTGYGEDLIRKAFGFDHGIVETLAHYMGAKAFDDDVSFILDIGGQDMKAIFVEDGVIQNIEINEACSSGCGSFIESFARSMGYEAKDFARIACEAKAPCDLGTRCTVFMNSRVKQALRENAEINDISAGLAYSVIKNALHKVLKVTNTDRLGKNIVVQGGTFKNPAVQKAMESLLEREVTCPDIAELMGAYGAALAARGRHTQNGHQESGFIGFDHLELVNNYERRLIRCHGCENKCAVTKLVFSNGNIFYSGNRCENIYSNSGKTVRKGRNMPGYKFDKLFNRNMQPEKKKGIKVGIPRVLNLFENFPFWNTLLVESGIEVVLSPPSSTELYKKGAAYIMSENLCYPAKLVSGHIMDLIHQGVDRILFPMVFFQKKSFDDAANCFNCPVVSGYADVIRSVIDPEGKFGVALDMPPVNIDDEKLLKKTCVKYLRKLGVSRIDALRAFQIALDAQQDHKQTIELEGASIIADAQAENRSIVLMLGRPYHIDPAINHKIPEILTGFGMDVITEAAVPRNKPERLNNQNVMTQWEYINRYYHASSWAAKQKNVIVVLLNSFGCGPDPFIMDEVSTILGEYGKNVTVLRIDEIESPGSAKLRLRSMLESVRQQTAQPQSEFKPRKTIKLYGEEDRSRTLVVPDYSMFYTAPLMRPFIDQGYKVVCMPPSNRESVETGLKYVHNEICYPGTILIGDFVKALQSGEHDLENTAVVFPQTGGQCRATSYASMIKKAMLSAGFEDIPVVTFSTNMQTLNQQPGFDLDLMSYMRKAAICLIYTDALSDMYYSTAVRELNKGDSHNTATRYIDKLISHDGELDREQLLAWLDEAVTSFNNIPIDDRVYPKVGIVGEIYVKYNEFSNNFVADWLMDHGIEVVVPTIIEFLSGGIISVRNKVKTHLQRRNMQWLLTYYGDVVIHRNLDMFKAVMQRFDRYQVHHGIRDIAKKAKKVVSLNHQYGEGWMLPGEVGLFAENGVTNVLCLQPFGCIANHVIAKGIQNRLKSVYPDLNLLFLDADAGVSEVNFFNRMHFFINTAKQDLKQSVPVY